MREMKDDVFKIEYLECLFMGVWVLDELDIMILKIFNLVINLFVVKVFLSWFFRVRRSMYNIIVK